MNDWSVLEKVGPPEKWLAMKTEYEEMLLKADTAAWFSEQLNMALKQLEELKNENKRLEDMQHFWIVAFGNYCRSINEQIK